MTDQRKQFEAWAETQLMWEAWQEAQKSQWTEIDYDDPETWPEHGSKLRNYVAAAQEP